MLHATALRSVAASFVRGQATGERRWLARLDQATTEIGLLREPLDPTDLPAAWRYVTMLEQLGEIDRVEAEEWRTAIYERTSRADAITDSADPNLR